MFLKPTSENFRVKYNFGQTKTSLYLFNLKFKIQHLKFKISSESAAKKINRNPKPVNL